MSELLREVQRLISAIDIPKSLQEPPEPVGEHDTVVGEITDPNARRIYSAFYSASAALAEGLKEISHFSIDHPEAMNTDSAHTAKLQELLNEQFRLESVTQILQALFWQEVRNAFPALARKATIGVRQGWKVVWINEQAKAAAAISRIITPESVASIFRGWL